MGNGPSLLHQAVLSGELDAVRGAIQNSPQSIDATEPSNGWTALHISSAKGYEVIVRELLARGAACNLIDKEGRTALHLAAGQGHVGIMRDLLRKGADPLRRDMEGKTPLDAALEKQHTAAVSLLSDALAGRGFPNNPTPTGSPTMAQAQAWQQQQQQQQGRQQQPAPWGAGDAHGTLPNLAGLDISGQAAGGGGAGASGGVGAGSGGVAYPAVPPAYPADDSWIHRLPVPPGATTGPVSIWAPSAPPVSTVYPAPPQHQQQRQPQQQVDYYDYIVPTAPQAAPAAAAAAPPLVGARAGTGPAYPSVPSAAPGGSIDAYAGYQAAPNVQQQQHQQPPRPQQQPQPQQRPLGQQQQQAAADSDDEGGWGAGSDDDDWGGGAGGGGGGRPSATAAAGAAAGTGGAAAAPPAGKQGPQPSLNAAVGAAVSGAGKVAGAVGSMAAAGAKQLLTGLLPKTPGARGRADDDDDDEDDDLASATWAGTPGRLYTYSELAAATQGFSDGNKLGAGGYGPVFRGMLDGLPVAVKLLDPAATGGQQGPKEFQAEVGILSRLHHPHIVLLIGSCPERCALVYELMDHGSLEQHLFSPAMPELQWQDRVRIACEVASALVFLHSAPEPIIHMDLKPGNLLLNRSLVCKVGDVGLSRLMPGAARGRTLGGSPAAAAAPVSTVMDSRLVGTPCYMDPEYLRTGRFGPKSDVYSLGVILLQMLTGLEASRAVSAVEAGLARCQADPASFASIVDPRAGPWPITEAASFAHTAIRCVALSRGDRPELRGEVLPALMQLVQRAKMYGSAGGPGGGSGAGGTWGPGGGGVRRSSSLSGGPGGPPSMMVCPITQDVMVDPVFAADGYTYEREAIAGWIASHSTSPMTNLPLANMILTPNLALRSAIKEWQDRHSGSAR